MSVVRKHPCEFCGHEFLLRLSGPPGVFGSSSTCPACGKAPTPPAPSGNTFPLPFKLERVDNQRFEVGEVQPEPLIAQPLRIFEEASVGEVTWVPPATAVGIGYANVEGVTKLELRHEPEDIIVQEGEPIVFREMGLPAGFEGFAALEDAKLQREIFAAQFQQVPPPRGPVCACGHYEEDHYPLPTKSLQKRYGEFGCRGRGVEECACAKFREKA